MQERGNEEISLTLPLSERLSLSQAWERDGRLQPILICTRVRV
jgi:hypothetical protein